MIDLTLTNRTRGRVPSRASMVRVCDVAAPFLKIPRGHRGEIGITFVGRTGMRTLNRTRRGIDTATDVLSFPLHMTPIQGYTAVFLGDVFICPDVVRADAKQAGMSERDRFAWAVVHGLLHLAGYDHEKGATAAKRMQTLERRILNTLSRE